QGEAVQQHALFLPRCVRWNRDVTVCRDAGRSAARSDPPRDAGRDPAPPRVAAAMARGWPGLLQAPRRRAPLCRAAFALRALPRLTDMSCPVHAHRTVHLTDPFEWHVEGNKRRLASLPVPAVPRAERASELIESLARFTQDFETDGTNHPPGRLLKRWGFWK